MAGRKSSFGFAGELFTLVLSTSAFTPAAVVIQAPGDLIIRAILMNCGASSGGHVSRNPTANAVPGILAVLKGDGVNAQNLFASGLTFFVKAGESIYLHATDCDAFLYCEQA